MPLLTKLDLDNAGCDAPDCQHDHSVLYIHPVCHPDSAVHVCYDKRIGALLIACAECGRPVAKIAPAERLQ